MLTMNDIASLSGCARSTVYAVLNNKTWVSEKTRKKVQNVIDRHQWNPNRMASGLVSGASGLIALILKDILNPFNSLILEGVNSILQPLQYNTLLLSTMDEHDRELEALQIARSYRVDGVIITPQQVGVDMAHLWKIRESGEVCVTLGQCPGIDFSYLELDEAGSARKVVDFLAGLGHRRIGLLQGPSTSLSSRYREEGFMEGILTHRLDYRPEYLTPGGATIREGYEGAINLLAQEKRVTAVVCYNDLSAAGVYRAVAEKGLKIPEDLSIVGFDDIELSSVFGPPLTTVHQPCFEMGVWMAEKVLSDIRIKNEKRSGIPSEKKIISGNLVVRASTVSLQEVSE